MDFSSHLDFSSHFLSHYAKAFPNNIPLQKLKTFNDANPKKYSTVFKHNDYYYFAVKGYDFKTETKLFLNPFNHPIPNSKLKKTTIFKNIIADFHKFYEKVEDKSKIRLLGHSIGGRCVEILCAETNIPTETYGIYQVANSKFNAQSNLPIVHFKDKNDILSKGSNSTGMTVYVDEVASINSLKPFVDKNFKTDIVAKQIDLDENKTKLNYNAGLSAVNQLFELCIHEGLYMSLDTYMPDSISRNSNTFAVTKSAIIANSKKIFSSIVNLAKLERFLESLSAGEAGAEFSFTRFAESAYTRGQALLSSAEFWASVAETAGITAAVYLSDKLIGYIVKGIYDNEQETLENKIKRLQSEYEMVRKENTEKILNRVQENFKNSVFVENAVDLYHITQHSHGKFLNHGGEIVSFYEIDKLVEEKKFNALTTFNVGNLFTTALDRPTNFSGAADFYFNFPTPQSSSHYMLQHKNLLYIYSVFRNMYINRIEEDAKKTSELQQLIQDMDQSYSDFQTFIDGRNQFLQKNVVERMFDTLVKLNVTEGTGVSDSEFANYFGTLFTDPELDVPILDRKRIFYNDYLKRIIDFYSSLKQKESNASSTSSSSFIKEVRYLFLGHAFAEMGSKMPLMVQDAPVFRHQGFVRYHPCLNKRFKDKKFKGVVMDITQINTLKERNVQIPWNIEYTTQFKETLKYLFVESHKKHLPLTDDENAEAALLEFICRIVDKTAISFKVDKQKLFNKIVKKAKSTKYLNDLYEILKKDRKKYDVDKAFEAKRVRGFTVKNQDLQVGIDANQNPTNKKQRLY